MKETVFERHAGINLVPSLTSSKKGFGSKVVNWKKCKFSSLNLNETVWD
jgi:hypothetical protein